MYKAYCVKTLIKYLNVQVGGAQSKVNGKEVLRKRRPPPAHGFGSVTDGIKSQRVANEASRSKNG